MTEFPAMASVSYASNSLCPTGWLQGASRTGDAALWQSLQAYQQFQGSAPTISTKETPVTTTKPSCRVVKVFIADPDENVPLSSRLLYSGQEILTDQTDQELFFDVDISGILSRHNELRAKIVNKAVKERVEYLEPVRIRDLRMTVVNVATF